MQRLAYLITVFCTSVPIPMPVKRLIDITCPEEKKKKKAKLVLKAEKVNFQS